MTFVWVFVAGGFGSLLRYLTGTAAGRAFGTEFPYGTLIVNVVGCFLIALVLRVGSTSLTPETRLILAVGVLGGFTTYSSFNYDTLRFATEGELGKAAVYFAVTTLGCAAAGLGGLWIVR